MDSQVLAKVTHPSGGPISQQKAAMQPGLSWLRTPSELGDRPLGQDSHQQRALCPSILSNNLCYRHPGLSIHCPHTFFQDSSPLLPSSTPQHSLHAVTFKARRL
eukprot:1136713-Pelagomonas_calceolata.AAC.3